MLYSPRRLCCCPLGRMNREALRAVETAAWLEAVHFQLAVEILSGLLSTFPGQARVYQAALPAPTGVDQASER